MNQEDYKQHRVWPSLGVGPHLQEGYRLQVVSHTLVREDSKQQQMPAMENLLTGLSATRIAEKAQQDLFRSQIKCLGVLLARPYQR